MTKQEFEAEVLAEFKGGDVKFTMRDDESWRTAYFGSLMVLHRGKRARPPGWWVGSFDTSAQPTLREAIEFRRFELEQERDRCNSALTMLDAAVGKVTP